MTLDKAFVIIIIIIFWFTYDFIDFYSFTQNQEKF